MVPRRHVRSLWLLLLFIVSGNTFDFDLFKRTPEPQEGDVRLFGSGIPSEGRVEVYHEGRWGTVCDDGWDMAEAQVVCRQLHFPGVNSVIVGRTYGQASGPIWMDDMECKGTETLLVKCAFKGWGSTDCSHKEDVGVICSTASLNGTMDNTIHSLDHSITLSDALGRIFDSREDYDFTIVVQSATGERRQNGTMEMLETEIFAHRIILSQFPLFNASKENTDIRVTVSPTCQPHFKSFIRYIYTHKIDVSSSSAQCLHWMASKFGVKQLMEDTGRLFSIILPEDPLYQTPLSLYEYSKESGDLVLQETCLQYLAWNFQNLTLSPAWTRLSAEILGALLNRSDLVVQDEYFLLETVESWITESGNDTSLGTQVDLLSLIRFPMISAENLYYLSFNSSFYSTHKKLYREKMLKAFQFNVLQLSNLKSNPKFNLEDDDYQPRIYTAMPWSIPTTAIPNRNSHSSYQDRRRYSNDGNYAMIRAPFHSSLILQDKWITWQANIYKSQYECSNQGLRCESTPLARLYPTNYNNLPNNIVFHNRLLLICQNKYVSHIQEFKDNLAHIAVNGTIAFTYPCPDDNFTYRFIVRPVYS